MSFKKNQQFCLICGDSADSLHFGALSCRACAAFFRRKVAGRRVLYRRCDRSCRLEAEHRKLCASCRFEKCLKVGMKETAVLSRIAQTADQKLNDPQSSAPEHSTYLDKLQRGYAQLEENRRTAFNITASSIPHLCNWKRVNEIFGIDLKLIMESLIDCFDELQSLSADQQKLLIAHFLVPFTLIEICYRSTQSELYILSNGDYIDISKILEYYSEGEKDESGQLAYQVFKPYWKLHNQNLKKNLDEIQLDQVEFLFLSGLVFWDFGLQDQTDECIAVCQELRTKIIEELRDYEKNVRLNDDHCYRVGKIIMILQTVQRTISIFNETKEISLIYNLYDHHFALFEAGTNLKKGAPNTF